MDLQGGSLMVLRPEVFFYFFILIPLAIIAFNRYRRGRRDLSSIGGKWRSRLLMDVFLVKWFFSSLLFILFVSMTILALAGFTSRGKTIVKSSSGLDIVFAVDISGSMLGTDVLPSRLKRSSDLIGAFIENFSGERFGLVVFKGSGINIVPMTEDRSYVSTVLPFLDPDMFSAIGSNVEDGINTSLQSFTGGEDRKKMILLFTDGESLSGNSIMAAESAKEQEVDIIIFGTGTEHGIELYSRGGEPVVDENNEIVISKLNSNLLQGLALLENVYYLNCTDSSVLSKALDIIIKQSSPAVVSDIKENRYRFFLSAAVLFLFLYISIRIFPWKNTF
jgi:Ca-activated chloride channel homolog